MAILYQRYSSLLYAFAYRIVADHQVAEDLLQESFLAVWQRASSYSPQLGAVAITHHRVIDYVRSRRSYVVFEITFSSKTMVVPIN
jgi:RNA polymerase sigma-70 factor (ECF subfamily)